ncbi:hypothetical protein PtA15_4A53 [Puccinia triticina]|uniref:ATPase domain-containing protein n=1 Tax=Puccinia triticina TaxID=208348 RepID=A0ABY7CEU2_9BASI|nr:uncharacterized protein PtA15_4A53 [Puccinia triticina]WAQ83605.1 hypothetical protein PtA15_4A53 [Puccinia triticina]
MIYRPCSTLKYLYAPNSQRAFKHGPAVEVKELTSLLKLSPSFRVILGPPSSGKTALWILQNVKAFLDESYQAQARDAFWKIVSTISEVEILGVSAKIRETTISTETAAKIFKELGNRLKPWKISHGSRPCVLIIDEANVFQEMSDKVIQTFLRFVVQVSKEEANLQVVFTSSDPFFESWLKKHVNSAHFETLVVGDLPYMEAKDYFLHEVKNHPHLTKTNKDLLESVDFQIPFRITGAMKFQTTQLAYTYLEDKILGKAKTYTGETALKVCELLVDSPGYVDYRKLSAELGNAVVEEMVQRNFLHFRPPSTFSRDLYPPPSRSVVTAQSEPDLRAMEVLVKESRKQ